jgi:hypothetical protein
MAIFFFLRVYTSNPKVWMGIFSLEGIFLFRWQTLLSQLGLDVFEFSWELFEENFREHYLFEEFFERQLNKFNSLT